MHDAGCTRQYGNEPSPHQAAPYLTEKNPTQEYRYMPQRTTLMIMAACLCMCVTAQRKVVVRDMETRTPLRDVQVFVNGNYDKRTVTDYRGEFTVPDTALTLTLCHTMYERLTVDSGGIADTIELLSKLKKLDEVVVYGKRAGISQSIMLGVKNATAAAPRQGGINFDFFELFNWKKRKRLRERQEAIKDY